MFMPLTATNAKLIINALEKHGFIAEIKPARMSSNVRIIIQGVLEYDVKD